MSVLAIDDQAEIRKLRHRCSSGAGKSGTAEIHPSRRFILAALSAPIAAVRDGAAGVDPKPSFIARWGIGGSSPFPVTARRYPEIVGGVETRFLAAGSSRKHRLGWLRTPESARRAMNDGIGRVIASNRRASRAARSWGIERNSIHHGSI